jgi:virginiamycin B lyase
MKSVVRGSGGRVGTGALLVVFAACAAPGTGDAPPGLGSVRFNLGLAPASARCAKITATPAMGMAVESSFEIGPGRPSQFATDGLPTGAVTLTEQVYTISCALLTTEMPTWISDDMPVTLRAGVALDVTFSLHLASAGGQVSVTSDFPRTAPVVTEFALTAGRDPSQITAGADGNMWFTEPMANKIGRITPAGVVTEFALPTAGALPTAIASGADESLWFTEAGAAKIGRITTSGAIREFTIPSGNAAIGIIAAPDGNVWFLEPSKVGRITLTGTVTEIGVPGHPKSITAGPDGAVWIAAEFFAHIDTGTLALTPLAGVGFAKTVPSFVAGSDGALWFTVTNNTAGPIGKVTLAGARSYFPLPESMQSAGALTGGSDGALWFTDAMVGAIGRITTGGTITEYLTPSSSSPVGIAAGHDGALWYTDATGKIGRLHP